MYRLKDGNQQLFGVFFLPFGVNFLGESRWIKLTDLIFWDELEHHYASQFSKGHRYAEDFVYWRLPGHFVWHFVP